MNKKSCVGFVGTPGAGCTTASGLFYNLYAKSVELHAVHMHTEEMVHEAANLFTMYNQKASKSYRDKVFQCFINELALDEGRNVWHDVFIDNLNFFMKDRTTDCIVVDGMQYMHELVDFKRAGGVLVEIRTDLELIAKRMNRSMNDLQIPFPLAIKPDFVIDNNSGLIQLENALKELKETLQAL